REEVAGRRDLTLVAAEQPCLAPQPLHLEIEDLRVGVDATVHAIGSDEVGEFLTVHRHPHNQIDLIGRGDPTQRASQPFTVCLFAATQALAICAGSCFSAATAWIQPSSVSMLKRM